MGAIRASPHTDERGPSRTVAEARSIGPESKAIGTAKIGDSIDLTANKQSIYSISTHATFLMYRSKAFLTPFLWRPPYRREEGPGENGYPPPIVRYISICR